MLTLLGHTFDISRIDFGAHQIKNAFFQRFSSILRWKLPQTLGGRANSGESLKKHIKMLAEEKAQFFSVEIQDLLHVDGQRDARITTKKCVNEAIRIAFQSKDFEPG